MTVLSNTWIRWFTCALLAIAIVCLVIIGLYLISGPVAQLWQDAWSGVPSSEDILRRYLHL